MSLCLLLLLACWAYALLAPANSGAGIGVPVTVAKATSSSSVAFLLPAIRLWRSGAGSRKARRSLFRYANLRPAATRLASGVGLNLTLRKQHTMNICTLPAPIAPIHPCAFTADESLIVRQAIELIESKRLRNAPLLHYFEDFQRYLTFRFAGLTNEQGHVLYLNINRELLAAETEFLGNQSSALFDLRQIVLRAITLGAEFVVFAHNHPGENPTPSESDVHHMEMSERALAPLKITLLDSYVVTSGQITSIRDFRDQRFEQLHREWKQKGAERRAKRAATRAAKEAAKAVTERHGDGSGDVPPAAAPRRSSSRHAAPCGTASAAVSI